jgi:hypothetical protein
VDHGRRSQVKVRRSQQERDAMQISSNLLLLTRSTMISLLDMQEMAQIPSFKSQNAPLYSYLTHPGPTLVFSLLPNREKSEGRLSPVTVQQKVANEISLSRNCEEFDKRFTRVGNCKRA